MIKTVFVGLLSFAFVSIILLLIGYLFDIEMLMFSFYKETATGFEVGGSVIPFIIGIVCSYFVGHYYQNRKRSY